MISTPVCDFVQDYVAHAPVRMHMPGHKGAGPLGIENADITEIDGAGELYAPGGIIADSEAQASALFSAPTFYCTEGSSQAIKAMLLLARARVPAGERLRVLAGRNAHRAFLSAATLIDFDVQWLYPAGGNPLHSCPVDPEEVDEALRMARCRCHAVYLTSPDYLGHMPDIAAIAEVCHRRGALLLVDNAHGAYLKFLSPSRHPMDLGADLCCDSAHKTLPVLTGGAYLHLRPGLCPDAAEVKDALALFGSSSPSWLILQSLDACNPVLESLPQALEPFLRKLRELKGELTRAGFTLVGDEPMKLTLCARPRGLTGDEMAQRLARLGIVCEYHDPDFLTLMPTPWNSEADLSRLRKALLSLPAGAPLPEPDLPPCRPEGVLSPRQAAFAPKQTLPTEKCLGRVLASPALSCPPCVPVAVCGERIDAHVLKWLAYYGIDTCRVIQEG